MVKPVLSRNTVTSLAHRGTVPHRRLDFFYSNKNYFVQLEDTTIKTELKCECDDAMSLNDVQLVFLFLYYAYPIILNDRLCRIYLFFSVFSLLTASC